MGRERHWVALPPHSSQDFDHLYPWVDPPPPRALSTARANSALSLVHLSEQSCNKALLTTPSLLHLSPLSSSSFQVSGELDFPNGLLDIKVVVPSAQQPFRVCMLSSVEFRLVRAWVLL